MAIYYKWIKGCQKTANLENGLWTYLTWGNSNNTGTPVTGETITTPGVYLMPSLKVRIGKNDTNSDLKTHDLGYLLTNKMPTPTLINEWVFQDGIRCNKISAYSGGDTVQIGDGGANLVKIVPEAIATESSAALYVAGGVLIKKNLQVINGATIKGESGTINTKYISLISEGSLILSSKASNIKMSGNTSVTGNISATDYIHSDSYCEAEYFNARSDMRAKENIKPATYNALELIKKLQIYTYNYINKPESVTGIMAQELLEVQPKELDLVSNINASGENGDYMSIKNDKLMFVLMKAIQEQQEKIEALEYELQCLKNN